MGQPAMAAMARPALLANERFNELGIDDRDIREFMEGERETVEF
jgi:hypothetical protein